MKMHKFNERENKSVEQLFYIFGLKGKKTGEARNVTIQIKKKRKDNNNKN